MSTDAESVDPRATFNYSIEIDGLQAALVEKVKIADVEIGAIEHSGAGAAYATKTGGKLKFADVTLAKVMRLEGSDKWAWEWLKKVRSPTDGTGQPASKYKKTITIIHYGPAQEIIDRWIVKGCWPKKIEYAENDASQEAEKMVETITLSIDKYDRA